MEDAGPQVADNATGISAEIAEDGTVSAETSGLVAPRKDGPARALQKWLGRMLEMKPRACSGMARQLLSGLINDSAPTSVSIRSLCRDPDPEKALRFFSALKIDEHTARRLISRTARSEIAARAKRHGAGGYRGHVGRHGPRAVQCAPLHPHEVLPAGVHAAR